jgi:hypothetical protein
MGVFTDSMGLGTLFTPVGQSETTPFDFGRSEECGCGILQWVIQTGKDVSHNQKSTERKGESQLVRVDVQTNRRELQPDRN